jgi:hypothetical protein
MSKIPQGEWNAIAARYAKGESISRIAQSYGCTPPAIHYILKKNKQRGAQKLNGRSASPRTHSETSLRKPTEPDICGSAQIPIEDQVAARLTPGENRAISGQQVERGSVRDAEIASVLATPDKQGQPAAPQHGANLPGARRRSAFTAGLDYELHGRAEAAIAAFRSSFDAALAEASPVVRQRLRQAASDLMRVAARTTIVLDRLNATVERDSVRTQYYQRSDPF